MKKLTHKLIYVTLIAALLGGTVSTAFAVHDPDRQIQWHLTQPDRDRFEAIHSGDNGF